LGTSARVLDKHQQASEWFRKAVVIAEELGDNKSAAWLYHSLTIQAIFLSSQVEGRDFALKALELQKELGDKNSLAELFHLLGSFCAQEDSQAALDWERQALEMYDTIGDRPNILQSLGSLQQIANAAGNYPQAIEWGQKRINLAEELGDKEDLAFGFYRMGVDNRYLENIDVGVECFLSSFAIYMELKSPDISTPVDQLVRIRRSIENGEFSKILKKHVGENIPPWFIEILDSWNPDKRSWVS
jgi:tetratricopeptide (TPR) repeat protein